MNHKKDQETPILLIDMDALELNIAAMQQLCDSAGVKLRPHTKSSKSPRIAAMQIAAGANGVCCAKLSEAAVMVDNGITDILITTPVVGSSKLVRLMEVASRAHISVVADNPENVRALSAASKHARIELGVLVELDVGQSRTGIAEPERLADLASLVVALPGLSMRGIQAYNGKIQHLVGHAARRAAAGEVASRIRAARNICDARKIPVATVSGGGTGTAIFDIEFGEINEIQAGSYIFLDLQYGKIEWSTDKSHQPWYPALSVLASVISTPSPTRVILDAGWKSLSVDAGPPRPLLPDGAHFSFGGDEHGILEFDEPNSRPSLGEKIELRPAHCDTTVSLYNFAYGVRKDLVEEEIQISGRGCSS